MHIMPRAKNQQTGSVILEALIAILIFSIGILALIGMQATAITTVADAKYRSTAGFLADQMVGTIWANRVVPNPAVTNSLIATPDPTFACNPCTTTSGNASTQAWVNSVNAALPNTAVANPPSIVIAGGQVAITVFWQSPKDPTAHHHTVLTFIN